MLSASSFRPHHLREQDDDDDANGRTAELVDEMRGWPTPATVQVRIEASAKDAAKVAAVTAGMTLEAWLTAAVNEKLQGGRMAEVRAKAVQS